MKPFDAAGVRRTVLDMALAGRSAHIGCAFSIVELLAVLYRNHLRFDPAHPRAETRDYLVLSKGHGVMALYACLHEIGWLSDEHIKHYLADGTILRGLADAHVPGVEATCGSLGHGLSVAVGLALGAQLKRTEQICYALVGDGELNEGTIWEACLFAAHSKLDNLIVIVDANGFQAMGTTDEVMNLSDIAAKLHAFGFDTLRIDGHDETAIDRAYRDLKSRRNKRPKAVIASTVKGKGVSFMEHDNAWHYMRLDPETYAAAVAEIAGHQ
jgi:transketolase